MPLRSAYFVSCAAGCHGKIASENGAFTIQGMTSKEQCHEAVRIMRELGLISNEGNLMVLDQIDESSLPQSDRGADRQFSMALRHFAQGIGDLLRQLEAATQQSPANFIHHDPNPGEYIVAEIIDEAAGAH